MKEAAGQIDNARVVTVNTADPHTLSVMQFLLRAVCAGIDRLEILHKPSCRVRVLALIVAQQKTLPAAEGQLDAQSRPLVGDAEMVSALVVTDGVNPRKDDGDIPGAQKR